MNQFDDDEQPGFFQRYGVLIGIVVFVLVGGGACIFVMSKSHAVPRKAPDIVQLKLLPPPTPSPPPPPPPPPPPVPPPPEKVVEQPPVKPDEPKPEPKLAKADLPPGPAGPKTSGPGDAFGLPGGGGGMGIGGGGGGSRFGWYAGEVQTAIHTALANNPKTRTAAIRNLKVRIWADQTGRVTRATITGSSDDPAVDAAIKSEVLSGLQLPEPPPSDLPMPIIMQIAESRPN